MARPKRVDEMNLGQLKREIDIHENAIAQGDDRYDPRDPSKIGGVLSGSSSRKNRLKKLKEAFEKLQDEYVPEMDEQGNELNKKYKDRDNFNRGTIHIRGKSYCSWGWFEDIMLNTHFGFVTRDKNGSLDNKHRSYIRSFSTVPLKEGEVRPPIIDLSTPTLCRFDSKHLYTINDDIILPHKHYPLPTIDEDFNKKWNLKSSSFKDYERLKNKHQVINDYFEPFKHPTKDKGIIRNFVFSADYLTRHFSTGVRNLESALNSFWNRVSSVYGGYWNFEIV